MPPKKRSKFPDAERPRILKEGQESLWLPEGAKALEYLRVQRHLTDEVIKQFQIGYCPRDADHDLAGRIIMPCCDAYGELVAFSTRDFEAPKKYQHFHESFDKSNYLYGLHIAKEHIRANDKAIVVEGQFDVKCLHSFNLKMTVGLFGTNLSIMHIALLARYCSEVYILLDPVVSGTVATEKIMQMYREYCLATYGLHFFPVKLPEELDPDDFVFKYGRNSLVNILHKKKQEVLYG